MEDFKNSEDVSIVPLNECEVEKGVIEHLVEERSVLDNWFVDYYIYANKVEAIETMGDNYNHCTAEASSLKEVLEITSQWC